MPNQQGYINNPLSSNPLYFMSQIAQAGASGDMGMLQQLAGSFPAAPPEEFSPYAVPGAGAAALTGDPNVERAKFAARRAASEAQERHIHEQDTEEGLLRRLLRPRDELNDALRQPPPRQR